MLASIIYVIMAPILVLCAEVYDSIEAYKNIRDIYGICKQEWDDLTEDEQLKIIKFYDFTDRLNERKLQMMATESSIQLTYQNDAVFLGRRGTFMQVTGKKF